MKGRSLKEALREIVTNEELADVVSSYDVVGDIAIVEIPDTLAAKKKLIASLVQECNPRVRTVVAKSSDRKGLYRTRTYEYLAGERRTETIHKESGCTFLLDISKVFFSVREGTERLRIANLVQDGERVLVMFAGVGPYAIVIAKRKSADVVAIELNPDAYRYMVINIKENKTMHRVTPVLGDVTFVRLGEFDRIVMPSPQTAHEYLDLAIDALKKGGVVHFYSIQPEKDLWDKPAKQLERAVSKKRRTVKIVNRHVVLPYAPRVYKVCVDAQVS